MGTDQVLYVHTYILHMCSNGFPCASSYYGFYAGYSTVHVDQACDGFFLYSPHKLLVEQVMDRISTIALSKDKTYPSQMFVVMNVVSILSCIVYLCKVSHSGCWNTLIVYNVMVTRIFDS